MRTNSSLPRHDAVLLSLGGAAGSLARYGVETLLPTPPPPGVPMGTLTVNLLGALLAGVVFRAIERGGPRRAWMQSLLGIGFCGGFSTLSSVSVEYVHLAAADQRAIAVAYVLGSLVAGGVLAWTGGALLDRVAPRRPSPGGRS